MSKTKGLGKGLSAIFDIEAASNAPRKPFQGGGIAEIKLDDITPNPSQPRTIFDAETLQELSQSISRLGLIQPITVKEVAEGKYFIISGERRYRASRMAGLDSIPAYVRPIDQEVVLELALVENIQREDLGAMEIAVTMQRLIEECDLTQEGLAERIGKKRSTIANYLRLLKLPAEVQFALREELISMGHARALLPLEIPNRQIKMLAHIIDAALSVRQVEDLVRDMLAPKSTTKKESIKTTQPESHRRLSQRLESVIGRSVAVKRSPDGKGRIVIVFDSDKDVEQILERLK